MTSHPIERAFPLTPLQQAMVLASVRDPEGSPYQAQCQVDLRGALEPELLREAWRRLVQRHESLRSFFAWEGREEPLQVVREDVDLPWSFEDWSDLEAPERALRWTALLERDASEPFDLSRAPVFRLTLVRLDGDRHRLLWSLHHALADGWSGFALFREMVEEYEALRRGTPLQRDPPPSFGRFVAWLGERDRGAAEGYWTEQLADLEDASPLPGARPGPQGPHRETVELTLDAATTGQITRLATEARVTPYTVLLAAWGLVLDRYAPGAPTVTFGTSVSERPAEIPRVEGAMGMYLNTVPLRIPAPGSTSVRDWLSTIQRVAAEARHHGVGGLGEISRWAGLRPGGRLARSLVVYESFPQSVQAPTPGSSFTLEDIRIAAPSDLPLALLAYPGTEMALQLVYDTALYTPGSARRLLRLTRGALEALTRSEASTLDALDILGGDERRLLLDQWSRSPVPDPPCPDVLDRLDDVVSATPEAPAVKDDEGTLTYRELDEAANALARLILARDLSEDALIGVPAEARTGSIVSILACLKAGIGYVPFDPAQPRGRLDRILGDVDLVLSPEPDPRWEGRHLGSAGAGASASAPAGERRADRVAYVVFTSGSTGRPKGVVVERGHLARSTAARLAWYETPPRRFLLLSSLAVDSSVAGVYWTLCTGGCLVLAPSRAEQDAAGLADRIRSEGVTTTLLVPSLWRTLLEEVGADGLGTLECVVVAGEACPPSLVVRHHSDLPGVRLVNEYGPSEATVWATAGDLLPEPGTSRVTIGRPVPFVRVYLLDARNRLVPPGAAGEICLAGDTVARGYLGAPETGDDPFGPDPFRPGGRMYRTGDRGRFREDGRLDFLGRVDDQLKIRGHRVEPGEIEGVLDTLPGVRESAVVLENRDWTDVDDLVARLLEQGGADAESLMTRLLESS